MAFHSTSRVGELVRAMRSASAENNPFTTAEGASLLPDAAVRARAGAASVQLLHGLAGLTEVTFEKHDNGPTAANEIVGLLRGFADSIELAASLDDRDAGL